MSTIVVNKVDSKEGLSKKQIQNLKRGQKLQLNYCGNGHSFVADVVFDKMIKEEDSCLVKITQIITRLGNVNFFVGDCVPVHFNELTLLQEFID